MGFYNRERLNSVLGNLPPAVFERNMAAKRPIFVPEISSPLQDPSLLGPCGCPRSRTQIPARSRARIELLGGLQVVGLDACGRAFWPSTCEANQARPCAISDKASTRLTGTQRVPAALNSGCVQSWQAPQRRTGPLAKPCCAIRAWQSRHSVWKSACACSASSGRFLWQK